MRLSLLPRAVRDLAAIEAYVSERGDPATARRVAARLRGALQLVAARPEIGRLYYEPDVREWSVPGLPYVIPYRIRGDNIEILRVFHSSRKRPEKW
jgi:toxin ParE1/3/4